MQLTKRKISFRGKCLKSNEWVYGDLIHGVGTKNGNMYILPRMVNLAYVKHCDPLDGVRVVPETIGQYTGIDDIVIKYVGNDNTEIYEGDLLNIGVEGTKENAEYQVIFERCDYRLYRSKFRLG